MVVRGSDWSCRSVCVNTRTTYTITHTFQVPSFATQTQIDLLHCCIQLGVDSTSLYTLPPLFPFFSIHTTCKKFKSHHNHDHHQQKKSHFTFHHNSRFQWYHQFFFFFFFFFFFLSFLSAAAAAASTKIFSKSSGKLLSL